MSHSGAWLDVYNAKSLVKDGQEEAFLKYYGSWSRFKREIGAKTIYTVYNHEVCNGVDDDDYDPFEKYKIDTWQVYGKPWI